MSAASKVLFAIPAGAEDDEALSAQLDDEFAEARRMTAPGMGRSLLVRHPCSRPGPGWALVRGMKHLYIPRYPTAGMGRCKCHAIEKEAK